jgi:hypothetical protein
MGHAGAIISGGAGTAAEKILALQKAGVIVAPIPSEIPGLMARALARRKPAPHGKTAGPAKGKAAKKKKDALAARSAPRRVAVKSAKAGLDRARAKFTKAKPKAKAGPPRRGKRK